MGRRLCPLYGLRTGKACPGLRNHVPRASLKADALGEATAHHDILALSLSSAGKVIYTLKTPYWDGTTQMAFGGEAIRTVDFIARLAARARARSDQNPE